MLCIACWIGDKSTMGDLCYFNNATHHLCLKLNRKLLGFQLSSLLPVVLSAQFVALAKDILFYSFGGALAGATGNVYGFERWLIRSQINDL